MDEDERDVEAVRAGDRDRFAALVSRHQGPVRALLRARLGTSAADDLAQEAFLRAYRALGSWRPSRGSFRAWLLAIARNVARDRVRRRGVRPEERPLHDEPVAPPQVFGDAIDGLDRAFAALSPERRTVLLLADVHGVPLEEIARIEDVPLGTVKSRLDRARKAMRDALGPPEGRP
jgi:RNA polymerase sigma-70 factor (ECF subfamily)